MGAAVSVVVGAAVGQAVGARQGMRLSVYFSNDTNNSLR